MPGDTPGGLLSFRLAKQMGQGDRAGQRIGIGILVGEDQQRLSAEVKDKAVGDGGKIAFQRLGCCGRCGYPGRKTTHGVADAGRHQG